MSLSKEVPVQEAVGALHLHTLYSDGGADYPEMIAAAKAVGLDFLVVTDHMTLKGKDQGYEGFSDDLLVIVGYEHNDRDNRNHYLIIGVDRVLSDLNNAEEYVPAVRAAGGIGFLAHPAEQRDYFRRYPPFPWTEWHVESYDGIELWNQMSEWVENLKKWYSFVRVFYPRRFLKGPPEALIRKWDELNRTRFVGGIGGVDAHSIPVGLPFFRIRIFPTKVELKGIRTHLLLESGGLCRSDTDAALGRVRDALRDGHGFISNFRRGDARGTRFLLRCADGSVRVPGWYSDSPALPARLQVCIPLAGDIRLMRNGESVQTITSTKSAEFDVQEFGVYRLEVRRRGKTWIFSNPFPVGAYPL